MAQQNSVDALVTDQQDIPGTLVNGTEKGRNDSLLQVRETLSTGDAIADKISLSSGVLYRIQLPDLVKAEPLPEAKIYFAQAASMLDGQAGLAREDIRC